jgi:elongation factor G
MEFKGVVDLLDNKAIIWDDETQGMTYKEVEIPEDLVETVKEYREKLVESVAEFDDSLLEKFFDNPDAITREELVSAIRKATVAQKITPVLCGSAFKNKGVQTMLDAVMSFMPSPLDVEGIVGTNPDTDEEEMRKPDSNEPFALWHSKLLRTHLWLDYVFLGFILEKRMLVPM